MKRGYMVHAAKNGKSLSLVLQTSNDGMSIINGREVMREFTNPSVEIVQKLGKSGSLFNVAQKPAWWVEITDSDGTRWPVRCRNLGDAKAIERWAQKHSATA